MDNEMEGFILKIKDLKLFCLLVSCIAAMIVAYVLFWSNFLAYSSWLSWSFGVGVIGVLLLHVKSFFSSDVSDLGFYYSRLYGLFFSLTYTSIVFLLILSFAGSRVSKASIFVLLTVVFTTGFYNFLRNNYEDMARKHLLAKDLIEKNGGKKE
jgi:hypothetical protein